MSLASHAILGDAPRPMPPEHAPPPPRQPPPLPPRIPAPRASSPKLLPTSRIPNAPSAVPTETGVMTTAAKMSLADIALQLRDEQIEARIVHYKADLETSPELDAITAKVVAELKEMKRTASGTMPAVTVDPKTLEIELMTTLRQMLQKLFRKDTLSIMVKRRLGEVSKRFARLFFESEIADKLQGQGDVAKAMRYPDQALFHLLSRFEPELVKELDAFEYVSPRVAEDAKTILAGWVQGVRDQFLARNTPELNVLVKMLNEVMTRFLLAELPDQIGELAWEVVKEAKLSDRDPRTSYKVSAAKFPAFRQAFETHFLQRLVSFAADAMLAQVNASETQFRTETIRFVADPHIYSDICEVVCDAVYDYLYNEGFLDMPTDWKNGPTAP